MAGLLVELVAGAAFGAAVDHHHLDAVSEELARGVDHPAADALRAHVLSRTDGMLEDSARDCGGRELDVAELHRDGADNLIAEVGQ